MTITRLIIIIVLAAGTGVVAGAGGTSSLYSDRLTAAAARAQVDAAQITDLLGQLSGLQQQIAGLQAAAVTVPVPAPVCPEVPTPTTTQSRRWPNGWTIDMPHNARNTFFPGLH